MSIPEPLMSPRIAALKPAIEAGDLAAFSRFWDEVEPTGTPLIEPIDNDNENAFVTFLWRADEEIENVILTGVVAKGWTWNDSRKVK
jgi:hypothetical protein